MAKRIPNDEIWVKVGGDKGGGSFKMNFQICNVAHPNSVNNTCVFCAFEAPDNPTNLRIALERYRSQIDDLSTKTWRYLLNFSHYICLCIVDLPAEERRSKFS